jgi:hypothetical protein
MQRALCHAGQPGARWDRVAGGGDLAIPARHHGQAEGVNRDIAYTAGRPSIRFAGSFALPVRSCRIGAHQKVTSQARG